LETKLVQSEVNCLPIDIILGDLVISIPIDIINKVIAFKNFATLSLFTWSFIKGVNTNLKGVSRYPSIFSVNLIIKFIRDWSLSELDAVDLSFIDFIILNMPLIIPGIAKINAAVVKPTISVTGCSFSALLNSLSIKSSIWDKPEELDSVLNAIFNGMNDSFKTNAKAVAIKKVIDMKLSV